MADKSEQGLLSLIRDSTSRAALEKYMLARGVDPSTAREASIKCEKAAIKNGALGRPQWVCLDYSPQHQLLALAHLPQSPSA